MVEVEVVVVLVRWHCDLPVGYVAAVVSVDFGDLLMGWHNPNCIDL